MFCLEEQSCNSSMVPINGFSIILFPLVILPYWHFCGETTTLWKRGGNHYSVKESEISTNRDLLWCNLPWHTQEAVAIQSGLQGGKAKNGRSTGGLGTARPGKPLPATTTRTDAVQLQDIRLSPGFDQVPLAHHGTAPGRLGCTAQT